MNQARLGARRAPSAYVRLAQTAGSVLAVLVAGCTSNFDIGTDRDAGRITPRTDLCGNGIDDDQNGAIDDGCPCGPGEVQRCSLGTVAESEVGACMAGTQTCAVASGVEWGDWGDYACSGAVGPAETEACDGVDDDCDGTIDEGCPCEAGATRACATDVATPPCMAGTQTCSGGTWSSCEGAITPTAEVCGDGVDNDCDGTVDPAILCACVPTAEVCRDGVDNDCDGATDEASCTILPDAGAPDAGGLDGAVCGAEVCDGVDNDCDGTVDDGACEGCRCDAWAATTAETVIAGGFPVLGPTPRSRDFEAAFDGEDTLAFLSASETSCPSTGTGGVVLSLRGLDGAVVRDVVVSSEGSGSVQVAWSGTRWFVAWTGRGAGGCRTYASYLAAFDPTGTQVAGPVRLDDAQVIAIAATGSDVYSVERLGTVRRFSSELAALGEPFSLSSISNPFDARALGDTVVVSGRGEPGTTEYVALLREGRVVAETALMQTASTLVTGALSQSAVTRDGTAAVACWSWAGGQWCRYVALDTGAALGPAFAVTTDVGRWDVVRAACGMAMLNGVQFGSGDNGRLLVSGFDATGSVTTTTAIRERVQPTQTLRAFEGSGGRLVRVTLGTTNVADGMQPVIITTLGCGTPPPPSDCATMVELACGLACNDTCGAHDIPCIQWTTSGTGNSEEVCPDFFDRFCASVDVDACVQALRMPPACWLNDYWAVPPDCYMPR